MRLTLNQTLYGTAQAPQSLKKITTGPLSFMWEGGNIRYVRFHGVEVLRAISFLVRDTKWGTYAPQLNGLKIKRYAKKVSISYQAVCSGEEGSFEYQAKIEGTANGKLLFSATGSSAKDFPTNRVGFVVLHPLEGVVGKQVMLEHTDSQKSKLKMPQQISADQPAFNLRAIAHSPVPGLKVSVEMNGDAYEMEDQRNWSDASFKTYVRPLSKPRPFVIPAQEILEQLISVNIAGEVETATSSKKKDDLTVTGSRGKFPELSLGLDPEDAKTTQFNAAILLELGISHFVVRYDTRTHHAEEMRDIASCLANFDAHAHFEVIVLGLNPENELSEFKAALQFHNIKPASIVVSPQRDLKTRPSGHLPEGEASSVDIAQIARIQFPTTQIGGGTFALFTEFNRNPPSGEGIDFVTHATCAIVHAADDISVMETLTALDDIAKSVRKLARRKSYRISPSAIAMRHNPYGASTAANPHRQRLTLALMDPRQSGLFAAAWAVGYLAAMVRNKVDMVGLAHGVGDFGVIEANGALRPIFHVLRGAAHGVGKRALAISHGSGLAAFGYQDVSHQILWVANLTAQPQTVSLKKQTKFSELSAKTFTKAANNAAFMDTVTAKAKSITLSAYAVTRFVL